MPNSDRTGRGSESQKKDMAIQIVCQGFPQFQLSKIQKKDVSE